MRKEFFSKLGEPDLKIGHLNLWVHGRQFEESQEYWDANWIGVTVHCAVDGASVHTQGPIVHLSELQRFRTGCRELHDTLVGEAKLDCMEPNLKIGIRPEDKLGGMEVEVFVTPDHLSQKHSFRFSIDQSYLPGIIDCLDRILRDYPIRGRSEL